MDLLFLSDFVQPDLMGGRQVSAWQLGLQLVHLGHRVTHLAMGLQPKFSELEAMDGMQVRRFKVSSLPLKQAASRSAHIREDLRRGIVPIVHSHHAYAEPGVAVAMPSDVPWVRTFHSPWHEEGWVGETRDKPGHWLLPRLRRSVRTAIEKSSLLRAQRVIVLSECFRDKAIELGVSEQRVRVIPGGTDLARYRPIGSKVEARERLGFDIDGPLLLTIRRLIPRMGVDFLVAAMPEVLASEPKAQLVIGGSGSERKRLEKQVKRLRIQNNVIFAGFIPEDQLADHYRAADLFVLPTFALEGFGLVTVDALACGTPVVGTPVGATPEILAPLDSRLLTSGTRSDELAE
ncbi:MAG: glycosyltransferase family 4 protein, partial [Prosthecobacter sp.]|nr:glycosyltransferase family 4 protein [Prosthecobacter sp.]